MMECFSTRRLGAGLGMAALLLGTTAVSAKTLVYCSEGSPENFTPALNTTGTSFDAARPVFDQLVEFERGSTKLKPGLAESWDVSQDGLTITFHLRKGVKFVGTKDFKPTRDFNADDVVWSFDRQYDEKNPYNKVSGGKFDYYSDMDMPSLVKAWEKKDDNTVILRLNEPNAPILANLAMDFGTIQSAEYADYLLKKGKPEQFDQVPVGTGPFVFSSYQKDAVIRFKANPNYWGGKPPIDDLVFAITGDATARVSKLKAGECQVASYPRATDLPELQGDSNLNLLSQPGLNIGYMAFNVKKPPLDKKEVRIALSMAIDKAAIIKEVYGDAGQPATNMIPSTILGYNKSIVDYPYDSAKAKSMLEAAGVTTPLDVDLWYMPVQRPYNPNAKRVAEMMQSDLAKIGVNAKLVTYEWGEYRKRLQNGEHMLGQIGWTGDNGDPDNFFFLLGCTAAREGGQNQSKWCNQDFEADLQKAKTLTDPAERAKLYEHMQVIAHDEQPQYNIAHSVVYVPVTKKVVDYKISPLGKFQFDGVDIK